MNVFRKIGGWADRRLRLSRPVRWVMDHPVPKSTASWMYVFGSATTALMALQFITGIILALVYVPSAADAWESLQTLNFQVQLGWYLRAVHGWGSNFMLLMVFLHMIQVFLFGAYKYPRELTWLFGVVLLLLTLGLSFTGQVLRFDEDAYWGLAIGASMVARTPIIGEWLVDLLLGGPIIAGVTLSRFFALHVFVLPGLMIVLTVLHIYLVLKVGVNEWPMPGRLVKRTTYLKEYDELVHKEGVPFAPYVLEKDLVFGGLTVLAVLICAGIFGPFGPTGEPDPTLTHVQPRPDPFFLWIFAGLALAPADLETFLILILPAVAIGVLLVLPFIAGTGEKSYRRRPFAVIIVLLTVVVTAALTWVGFSSPWSPDMDAWSGRPLPEHYIRGRSPLELQGALVFQNKQCRNCHLLGGEGGGGQRGPGLDEVGVRQTKDQLIRQVLQGGGEMPAYGKNLSPAEVTALVAFLQTLRPPTQAPPRTAAPSSAPPPSAPTAQ